MVGKYIPTVKKVVGDINNLCYSLDKPLTEFRAYLAQSICYWDIISYQERRELVAINPGPKHPGHQDGVRRVFLEVRNLSPRTNEVVE